MTAYDAVVTFLASLEKLDRPELQRILELLALIDAREDGLNVSKHEEDKLAAQRENGLRIAGRGPESSSFTHN